jgi:hypothetical protein
MQSLRDPIDEQIEERVLAEVASGKALIVFPKTFGDLAHCTLREQTTPRLIGEGSHDVAH